MITPAGPVTRDQVRPVKPGEAVRRNDDGTYTVVRASTCHEGTKEESAIMTDTLVLTPGGYRPRSLVRLIEPGHILDGTGGRLRKLDLAGKVMEDFGPWPRAPATHHSCLAMSPT